MTHNFFKSHFYWCLIWFMLLLSHSTQLLSKAASPWQESSEPDAASRVPCDGIDHHPWTVALPLESNDPSANLDMPSLDTAMQSLPIGDTSAAQTCGVEEEARRTFKFPEASPILCGRAMETVLLKGPQQPNSGEAIDSHNSNPLEVMQAQYITLPQQACHFNPNPATTSVRQDHGNMPTTPVGHIDACVFEAELRKGSKPPTTGQPSPIHNSIPNFETFNQVDVSLKEPASGGYGEELAAKNGHDGNCFVRIGDSSDLQNILARSSVRPGAGSPSKGHNSITDRVASE